MSNPQKRKGDRAEREIAAKLSELLGVTVRRKLGAGRTDDEGDLEGLPGVTIEVKNYRDIAAGITRGLHDLERERANAATPHGVLFVRRPRGQWIAVMPVEAWCDLYEATR